jgi:hypothetical protein
MDSLLIVLVVTVLAALSNWLQQRAQSRHEPPPDTNRPPQPRPQPRTRRTIPAPTAPQPRAESSLERELRRLLGEEIPQPPRPRPPLAEPPAPPPIHPLAPHPTALGPHRMPPPSLVIQPPVPAEWGDPSGGFHRAQQLHESVAERLRQVDAHTESHGAERRSHALPPALAEAHAILGLRHNPQAARQAFIASLVFGTPKGLEP